MKFDDLLTESDPQPHALRSVKKICSSFRREHRDKHYVLDYKFTSPTQAVITLTINRWLSSDRGDREEFSQALKGLMHEAHHEGTALKVGEGDAEFAGDVVDAVATQMIAKKENLRWDLFVSMLQVELTYGVREK